MPDRDVRSGLTQNGQPLYAPSPSFEEQLAQAAKAAPAEPTTPEPRAQDLSLDSDEEVIRQITGGDKSTSTNIQEGLTTVAPAEQRDRYGRTAEERSQIHADFQRIEPVIESEAKDRQLAALQGAALETYQDAVESGDYDEMVAAAVDLRAVDPATWARVLKVEYENEIDERARYMSYDGTDDDFQEEHERVMSERTDAQELAQEVEANYLSAKSLLERQQAEEGRLRAIEDFYGDDALEGFEGFLALQKAVAANPERLDNSQGSEMIREALSVPLDRQSPEQLAQALRLAHGLADDFLAVSEQERRAGAIERAQKSILEAPSRDVASGLTTPDTEMAKALREQNALLHEGDPAEPINGDRAFARALGWSEPVRRRETAAEIRASVAAPSERSVASGLTEGGRRVSVDDAIARGQGFTSAKARVQEEERAARARDLGITR
jgi:hypothetical protein